MARSNNYISYIQMVKLTRYFYLNYKKNDPTINAIHDLLNSRIFILSFGDPLADNYDHSFLESFSKIDINIDYKSNEYINLINKLLQEPLLINKSKNKEENDKEKIQTYNIIFTLISGFEYNNTGVNIVNDLNNEDHILFKSKNYNKFYENNTRFNENYTKFLKFIMCYNNLRKNYHDNSQVNL